MLTHPRSSASCGIGDAIEHNLCRVNLPIITVFVQVLTMAQSAPVVLIEHLRTIANADLLDSTLCAFICLKKPGIGGCTYCLIDCFCPVELYLIDFSFFFADHYYI